MSIDFLIHVNQQILHLNSLILLTEVFSMGYPNTLFFLEYPTDKFVNSVEWLDSEAEFRPIKSFGNIIFG